MAIRFRKFELIPTLVMMVVTAGLFKLGFWQLERLQWKTDLLYSIEKAQSEAPRDLLSYRESELSGQEWHNVIVTGRLLNDKEMYATPRYLHDEMGYAILTPLEISTAQGRRYVIVNRGWVPTEKKDPTTRRDGNVDGKVRIEGVIRGNFKQLMFRPDNVPAKNLWFWYELPAMAKFTKLELMPVMIDATRTTAEDGVAIVGGPAPFPIEVTIRNDHLGYALTWFLIGIAGVIMFLAYYLEPKQRSHFL